ncbi:hypothetical protein FOL47_003406 [Perkinsus chesapeaki]|uniref:Uncharacterized protein n=1 Tax=Perkinsus chesapeaki TaxID=330153 RepID=A0A7J6M8E2_PERCH|nr:hypothetical protein FOL47_003406 [Perkinsus chesapeaki]
MAARLRVERHYGGYGSDSDVVSEGRCLGVEEGSDLGESLLDDTTNEFTAMPTTAEEYLRLVRKQTKACPKVVTVVEDEAAEGGSAMPDDAVENLPIDRSEEILGEKLKSGELVQAVIDCFDSLRGKLNETRRDSKTNETEVFDSEILRMEPTTQAIEQLSASAIVEGIEYLALSSFTESGTERFIDWTFCLLAGLDIPLLDCTMSSLQLIKRKCVHLCGVVDQPALQSKCLILIIIIRGFFGQR